MFFVPTYFVPLFKVRFYGDVADIVVFYGDIIFLGDVYFFAKLPAFFTCDELSRGDFFLSVI